MKGISTVAYPPGATWSSRVEWKPSNSPSEPRSEFDGSSRDVRYSFSEAHDRDDTKPRSPPPPPRPVLPSSPELV
jgi:hypothetical protein